jgi:hypothetical protein
VSPAAHEQQHLQITPYNAEQADRRDGRAAVPLRDENSFVASGPCFACKNPFAFDTATVPSIPIDPTTGLPPDMGGDPVKAVRQPVCPSCVAIVNAQRAAHGMEQIPTQYDR